MYKHIKLIITVIVIFISSTHIVYAQKMEVNYQTETGYPPFKFTEGNYLNGFDIELTNLIFNNQDYNIKISTDSWNNIYNSLINGEIDTCGIIEVTEDRKNDMLFSNAVLKTHISVYLKRALNKRITLNDLNKYRVGIANEHYTGYILKNEVGIDNYSKYESVEDAVNALYNDEIDILFENQEVVNYILVKKSLNGIIIPEITNLYPANAAYAVSKDKVELLEYINKKLADIKKAGMYEQIYQKYFYKHSDHYWETKSNQTIGKVFIIIFGLFIIFMVLQLYIRYLREKVSYEQVFSGSIVNNANLLIVVWKMDGTVVKFNRYAELVTGFRAQDVLGKKWLDTIIPAEIRPGMKNIFRKFKSGEIVQNNENAILCTDGTHIDVLWNNSVIYNSKGDPVYVVSMGVDVTEQKNAARELRESYDELEATHEELVATQEELSRHYDELQMREEAVRVTEERYRLAVEGSKDGIWDWDIKNNSMFLSKRGRDILELENYENDDSFEWWSELIHPEDYRNTIYSIRDYFKSMNSFYSKETRIITKNGEAKWVLLRGQAIWDQHGYPIRMAGSCTDITEQKITEEKIHSMAFYDALTGLPNRTLLIDRLTIALREAERNNDMVALFFLDLDNFKTVNDTLGHSLGDTLLQEVGTVLEKCMRKTDTVARLGGDEFILMQSHIKDLYSVFSVAERILQEFKNPWTINNHDFYVTTSIGITIYPNDGKDVQTLLKNADTAMYKAKELGKNNYQLFKQYMNEKMMERVNMENRLRYAIEREEFVIYYQPQIDIKTKKVVGAEALLRWIHPEKGLVSPMAFIPIAEETGLIIPIGEWVLKKACEQSILWQSMGLKDMSIAVNLSVRQFQQKNLIEMITGILEETGLHPQFLELEITESLAMKDFEYTIEILKKLRNMGIRISLDDFGTGYSSLNYLKLLPINTLKIDKTFVDDITKGSNEAAIAKTVIKLAHDMKLKVNAEGVERIEQYIMLKEENCDTAQGYLFGKPVPAEEFVDLFKNDGLINQH